MIIERRKRIVENINLGVARHGAGDRKPLLLPAREIAAVLRDVSVVTVLFFEDKIGALRNFHGAFDFLVRRVVVAEVDIRTDTAREQHRLLRNITDLFVELALFIVAHVVPVDENIALGHVIKTRNKVDDRAFSATR